MMMQRKTYNFFIYLVVIEKLKVPVDGGEIAQNFWIWKGEERPGEDGDLTLLRIQKGKL